MSDARLVDEAATDAAWVPDVDLETRLAELELLGELGIALSTTVDLDDLLDRALAAVVRHLHVDRALTILLDEERGRLGLGRTAGADPDTDRAVRGWDLSLDAAPPMLRQLASAAGPMLFTELDRSELADDRALAERLGVHEILGAPLATASGRVGILLVDRGRSGDPLGPAEGALLFTVATVLGAAIENARLYASLEEHNRTLELRVAQRTAQLADALETTEAARLEAERANDQKSRVLSAVSHELRTPLASIVGFNRIIRRRLEQVIFPAVTDPGPRGERAIRQVDEDLGIVVIEAQRLTAMIDDILDLAKIESGRMDWRREPIRIDEILTRATAATGALFEPGGPELRLDVPTGLPDLIGDRDRLIQVIVNLLSNAAKFTPDGRIRVSAAADDDEVRVSVADTGIGIAPEDQERIWRSYEQVASHRSDGPRGTGLGLPICRRIIEEHGGRMWLESEPGQGSTFHFALPVPVAEDGPRPGTEER
jgi:signal transduction histidine kinase